MARTAQEEDHVFPRDTALAALSIAIVVGLVIWALRRHPSRARFSLVAALLAFGELVIVAAFFPLPIQAAYIQDMRAAPDELPWTSLVPLASIVDILGGTTETALRQLAGNVLLFVPFGYILPLLIGRGPGPVCVFAYALGVSVVIELSQLGVSLVLGFPYRLASADDVILNVLGAGVGYSVYLATRRLVERRSCRPRPVTGLPERTSLGGRLAGRRGTAEVMVASSGYSALLGLGP